MNDFPVKNNLEESFSIYQVTNAKEKIKIVAHLVIISKKGLNEIKFDTTMYAYISSKQIYINIDRFLDLTSSVSFIREEYLVCEFACLLSSVGGYVGLFFGISFFDFIFTLVGL